MKIIPHFLTSYAKCWWDNYKFHRKLKGKPKIRTWSTLKGKLENKSLVLKAKGENLPKSYDNLQEEFDYRLKKCFRCQGRGHVTKECTNKRVVTIEKYNQYELEDKAGIIVLCDEDNPHVQYDCVDEKSAQEMEKVETLASTSDLPLIFDAHKEHEQEDAINDTLETFNIQDSILDLSDMNLEVASLTITCYKNSDLYVQENIKFKSSKGIIIQGSFIWDHVKYNLSGNDYMCKHKHSKGFSGIVKTYTLDLFTSWQNPRTNFLQEGEFDAYCMASYEILEEHYHNY